MMAEPIVIHWAFFTSKKIEEAKLPEATDVR
jgi:hypothetical protein